MEGTDDVVLAVLYRWSHASFPGVRTLTLLFLSVADLHRSIDTVSLVLDVD